MQLFKQFMQDRIEKRGVKQTKSFTYSTDTFIIRLIFWRGWHFTTAWYMIQRIRGEMQNQEKGIGLLRGIIEADETFVRATSSSQYKNRKDIKRGRGTKKMTYIGAMARNGKIVVKLVDKTYQPKSESLGKQVITNGASALSGKLCLCILIESKG